MTDIISISYIGCQSCQARVHCEECEARLSDMLMRLEGVNSAIVQMANKQLTIDSDLECDALEEILEDVGIFFG